MHGFGTTNYNVAAELGRFGRLAPLLRLFENRPIEQLRLDQAISAVASESGQAVLVVSGALRCVIMLADGRRAVTRFVYPGEVLDLSAETIGPCLVEAAAPTRVTRIGHSAIEYSSRDSPEIRSFVSRMRRTEVASAHDYMLLLACKTAQERVCSFLLDFMSRNEVKSQNDIRLELPMCRRDIADHLGLTTETVSRTFTKLIQRGALRLENCVGRKTIIIKQRGLLVRLAACDP